MAEIRWASGLDRPRFRVKVRRQGHQLGLRRDMRRPAATKIIRNLPTNERLLSAPQTAALPDYEIARRTSPATVGNIRRRIAAGLSGFHQCPCLFKRSFLIQLEYSILSHPEFYGKGEMSGCDIAASLHLFIDLGSVLRQQRKRPGSWTLLNVRQGTPLCQRSCRLNRIGTFGGADSRKWLDTDKRTKIG